MKKNNFFIFIGKMLLSLSIGYEIDNFFYMLFIGCLIIFFIFFSSKISCYVGSICISVFCCL